jgi:hypothetical protein
MMASTVKIERFDVNVTQATGQTHTLTNTVVLNNAFVRRVTSIDKQSGPTGSTGNSNPNVCSCAAYLSSTTQVSFVQDGTTSQKVMGEVWRFTGSASDPDEFIVRGRHTITLTATNATGSAAVSGISSVDDCIPFWTGSDCNNASVNDYDSSTVAVWIDGSGNIQVERGATTGTLVVYVTVVEFTGSNWSVGHAKSTSHDTADATGITIRTNSLATTGTFDVKDWEKATIIEGSLEGDTSETGLSDNLGCWEPSSSTTTVNFDLHQDGAARNDGIAFAHILAHQGLIVKRANNTNWAEGNGTYATVAWPTGASTGESLDELAMEWFADTSGTGTAHARGRVSAEIQTASTARGWVHRSGNNVRITYGVIDLSGVDGTAYIDITDVDTDEIITNTQTNVVITSTGGFESTQGTGKVELVENSDYTGTKVEQTSIDSWADTSIQFDAAAGALADTHCYLFVTADGGGQGSIPVQVGNPPETYAEAIENITPAASHLWKFQNSYADEIGSATANNSSGGTPTFSTSVKICKGDTHSLEINGTDYISPADQADMNITVTANRRYIGGWIQLDSIGKILSVIYEEGAQVNNIAILNGFGNNVMAQVADTGDHYIQLYCDVSLTEDRPYHILLNFNASGYNSGNSVLYLDGVAQSRDNNQPWDVDHMDTHSGNISWGHEGTEQLQVGDSDTTDNVDITFASPDACYYSHWVNFTDVTVASTDIRKVLFEKGAPAEETISAGTESVMQTALNLIDNKEYTDWPCSIEIAACTDGDFELELDNITFEERVSMQIRYMGVDTLTLVKKNGTELDTNKLGVPYGGTITVVNAPPVTITVKDAVSKANIQNAIVFVEANSGGDLPSDDSVTITRASSTATVSHTGHGLSTGNKVCIRGANQEEYNGIFTITVTTANAYTYTVSGTPTSPATGTITATAVIINELTDASGIATENLKYTSNQPIRGLVRKSSSSPYYQEGTISGTVASTGYSGTILLISDE